MELNHRVFDVWSFRRQGTGVEYLLLQTSELKAERYFNGGRFWQIPSGVFRDGETVPEAIDRVLAGNALHAHSIWAAEHAYTIYNRRFREIQIISVYAAELASGDPQLNPEEHSRFGWFRYEAALAAVHYRGLKDGLRSVHEYVTGPTEPAPELCLRAKPSTR
ncbi:MAG TPA: NUDIX domain-containing protein [Gemmatimonadaceae bacterium]